MWTPSNFICWFWKCRNCRPSMRGNPCSSPSTFASQPRRRVAKIVGDPGVLCESRVRGEGRKKPSDAFGPGVAAQELSAYRGRGKVDDDLPRSNPMHVEKLKQVSRNYPPRRSISPKAKFWDGEEVKRTRPSPASGSCHSPPPFMALQYRHHKKPSVPFYTLLYCHNIIKRERKEIPKTCG